MFPKLKGCITCPRTNRREETVTSRLYIGHSYITQSFVLKGEELPVCIACDQRLTVEHILPFGSDIIEIGERHGERGWLSGYSTGLVIEMSRVRIPPGAAGEFSSPGSTFCADSYFGIRSTPVLPQ